MSAMFCCCFDCAEFRGVHLVAKRAQIQNLSILNMVLLNHRYVIARGVIVRAWTHKCPSVIGATIEGFGWRFTKNSFADFCCCDVM